LRDLIFKIGGGIINDKKFKAVQTGGPSGGNIPEKYLDLPVDYEALTGVGSMMGSGGMVVMDEDTCMVQIARYFLSFTQEESCGKCTPCRDGTNSMLKILDKFIAGKAEEKHLDELEKLALMIKETSLCGLGKSAPNPVLTTLKYFRDEYRAHIKGTCPAKVCPELIKYEILEKECTGCTVCAKNCPQNAITGETKKPHEIIQDKCIKCGICLEVCKFNAVRKV
ncbi:MAG: NADH-ubiquinone oxidoreductase-F iron-sulfur binding region domain-containing protein, partial [Planctomycetota bacterium]